MSQEISKYLENFKIGWRQSPTEIKLLEISVYRSSDEQFDFENFVLLVIFQGSEVIGSNKSVNILGVKFSKMYYTSSHSLSV